MTPDEHWTLFRADSRATPFQSPAWVEAWWEHLGGGERHDLQSRDAHGRLIGVLPMHVWNDAGVRRLVPVAAGHSDYSDALIDPGAEEEALAGLWASALAVQDRWDELLLPDLRERSPLMKLRPDEGQGPVATRPEARPRPSPGWVAAGEAGEACPVLTLPAAPPLLAQLTKSQRRKVVHDRHRADALGQVTVAFAAPDEIDDGLTALFTLHAARWRLAGEEGVLAEARVQAFHRAAAPALAAAGLLRLVLVRHAGRIVSALYAFADAWRGYSYAIGSDFSLAKQSFGTLAFAHAIEDALAGGASEYHFLRGQEAYKYQWGAVDLRTVRRTIRHG